MRSQNLVAVDDEVGRRGDGAWKAGAGEFGVQVAEAVDGLAVALSR